MIRTRTRSPVVDASPDASGYESAYRRGVHQALAFALELTASAGTVRGARARLARAERLAGELRGRRRREGAGALLDHMRLELALARRRDGSLLLEREPFHP